MKINIDTNAKTIHIEENVKIDKLVMELESLFPNGLWKEYTLNTNVIFNTNYIPYYPQTPVNPYNPPFYPTVYGTTGDTTVVDYSQIKAYNQVSNN